MGVSSTGSSCQSSTLNVGPSTGPSVSIQNQLSVNELQYTTSMVGEDIILHAQTITSYSGEIYVVSYKVQLWDTVYSVRDFIQRIVRIHFIVLSMA